jgi:hypothetical protein|tara:strand:- start:1944 stop:2084 length:141 start_codon:yes stop_codon:yes gene_type:complete
MRCIVKLQKNGYIIKETVHTDDPYYAESVALARNPGAEVLSSDVRY